MLGKEGSGRLSETHTSNISYYELDGKGNWRVCRVDSWWPPSAGDDEAQRASLRQATERYAKNNPALKKLGTRHMALFSVMYFYDSKGRIARLEQGSFLKPGKRSEIKICRQYDNDDNLTLLLNPRSSQSCLATPPDLRDEWWRHRYGKHNGQQVMLLSEWHRGDVDGTWSKDIWRFSTDASPGAVGGAAKAESGKGVTVIYNSNAGKLDDNAANTVVDSFGRVSVVAYFFPTDGTSLEVLENPEKIYQYLRRRETQIDGRQSVMYELFKPNEHRPRHRYYVIGNVMRQEQLDPNGRVTRVITVNGWQQPRPGPRPAVNDALLAKAGGSLRTHQVYHRVFELDAQGKPTLVAISWNRELRLNPLKKTHIDFADLRFGTPDGKIRWKNLEEFEKHFNFSANATHVFPDVAAGKELERY